MDRYYVTPSKGVLFRAWYDDVKHLYGKKMLVHSFDGDYIKFYSKDRCVTRRWHKSHLIITSDKLVLENK